MKKAHFCRLIFRRLKPETQQLLGLVVVSVVGLVVFVVQGCSHEVAVP